MRTLWNTVSFLAVVHLLALAMFIGWLAYTQRLDRHRVEALRELFATTILQEQALGEQEAREAESREQARLEQARRENPPLPSAERIELAARQHQKVDQSMRRLEELRRQLFGEIDAARQTLQEEIRAFEAERRSWEEVTEAERTRKGDAQFAKAVKLLETLPPKQAKEKIVELMKAKKAEQAVAYLNAMNPRAAGKVLAEFKSAQENRLATELLERLRTFGLAAERQDSADADDVANAAEPP